jgi:acyl-CoA thioester hydrolase
VQRSHTIRLRVRHHDMDVQGHVNNAVYLHYVEEAAIEHAGLIGFGAERLRELGGTWVVHRHAITYRRPAVAGDELDVTTTIASLERTRGIRRTTIARRGELLAEAETEWVWVGIDGRPRRLPAEAVEIYAALVRESEESPHRT